MRCVSCRERRVGYFFKIWFVRLCLLIRELRLFTVSVIIERFFVICSYIIFSVLNCFLFSFCFLSHRDIFFSFGLGWWWPLYDLRLPWVFSEILICLLWISLSLSWKVFIFHQFRMTLLQNIVIWVNNYFLLGLKTSLPDFLALKVCVENLLLFWWTCLYKLFGTFPLCCLFLNFWDCDYDVSWRSTFLVMSICNFKGNIYLNIHPVSQICERFCTNFNELIFKPIVSICAPSSNHTILIFS